MSPLCRFSFPTKKNTKIPQLFLLSAPIRNCLRQCRGDLSKTSRVRRKLTTGMMRRGTFVFASGEVYGEFLDRRCCAIPIVFPRADANMAATYASEGEFVEVDGKRIRQGEVRQLRATIFRFIKPWRRIYSFVCCCGHRYDDGYP